jgi:hypothetical protein
VEYFKSLGQTFPEQPINIAVWGIWSLCFALSIYIFSRKFSLVQTALFAWFIGFVMMWLVIGNYYVLPFKILPIAIPLSLIEAFVASLIFFKLSSPKA